MNSESKCGYVAIVGRPNVGKSTLLNHFVGQKISIITPKPQTTRTQILGIKTQDHIQAVFIDTPGLHQAEKRAMNRYMNRLAHAVMMDTDVIVFVVQALQWKEDDEMVLEKLKNTQTPVVLAVNKVDLLKDKSRLLPFIEKLEQRHQFAAVVPFSAKRADNVEALEKVIFKLLPEGPHLFPEDQVTDKNDRFHAAEVIREKLIQATEEELPYSTTVEIESFKEEEKLIRIHAVIWVEREGQKAIVIGKGGEMLKKIGTQARKELEKTLEQKVFLQLWVKVKDNWTDNEKALQQMGY